MQSVAEMRIAMRRVMEGYSMRASGSSGGSSMEQARRFSSFFSSPSSSSSEQQEGPPPPPNPPDPENPDPATLREQWRYAISLYSKWYSHAWGTAILAGLSFFALGWFVKGGNPLLSNKAPDDPSSKGPPEG